MAERRPLVVVSGQAQELPAGDSLPTPIHAWCNFNGDGAPLIRAAKNTASVSYSSGLYRMTFGSNMPDEHYAVSIVAVRTGGGSGRRMVNDVLTKNIAYCEFKITSTGSSTATNDSELIDVIVAR